jgi:hypothetical protein
MLMKNSHILRSFKLSVLLIPALVLVGGCSAVISGSDNREQYVDEAAIANAEFSYEPYAEVLETYVDEQGLVDYEALQASPGKLLTFNALIGEVSPETYANWSEAEQIAFLVNAYNSFTLESIIDQQPLKASIRDIPGVWRIREFAIAGESKTLDNIEHQTLRVDFNEPRIHAALVCAAISCPPLRTEPYTGENLDVQLDDQVNQWLNGPHGLRIDRTENAVYISAIFDWFGEDWIPSYGADAGFTGNDQERAVLNFISQYLDAADAEYLRQGNYELRYLDYDWSLNMVGAS